MQLSLQPWWKNFTPALARTVASPRVWSGTSVILQPVGSGCPASRAISTEKRKPRVRSSRSSDSVCVVKARAWGTSRPARMAARNRSRRSARLARPENLRHRPAGQGPGELLVRRQAAALVDQLQGLVGHRSPVAVHDAAGKVREADIEMRLGNDDHFLQLRPGEALFWAHAGIAAWMNNAPSRNRDAKRSSAGRELG